MRLTGVLKSGTIFATFAILTAAILTSTDPAEAQTVRCAPSSAAGEPTDPERATKFPATGRLDAPPAFGTNLPSTHSPGVHPPAIPTTKWNQRTIWFESFSTFLRRFGIIVPKGTRS